MATRFTRLSVVAGDQQLDASLPASRPIVEFFDHIPTLLGIPATAVPTTWSLSSPARGSIALQQSLDEAGVLDGEVLYLSAVAESAQAPVIDDVVGAVAATVDGRAPEWADRARDVVITCLLGFLGVALTVALALGPNDHTSAVLLVLLGAAVTAAAVVLRPRGGIVLGWAIVPVALAAALYRVSSGTDVRLAAAAAGAAAGIAALGQALHRSWALAIAGSVTAVGAAGTALFLHAGVDATALAAWAAPALLLVIALLPQVALSASGLPTLVRQAEAGEPADRRDATRRTALGLAVLDGLVAAMAALSGAAAATLIWAGRPAQASLGGLLAGVILLRSRGFTPARPVGWLVSVPVVAAVAAAAALPRWFDIVGAGGRETTSAGALLAIVVVVAAAGYLRLGEVPSARLSKLWDRVDLLAVLALIPLTLLAQNVFGWLAHRF
jgi:type VII secretion integral membrane protein EccD